MQFANENNRYANSECDFVLLNIYRGAIIMFALIKSMRNYEHN